VEKAALGRLARTSDEHKDYGSVSLEVFASQKNRATYEDFR